MGYPARLPSPIGITIRELDPVPALVQTILQSARDGGLAIWLLPEILTQLKLHHWAAYAREAECHVPSRSQVAEVVHTVRLKIQSMG